jgi:hypothetical protein
MPALKTVLSRPRAFFSAMPATGNYSANIVLLTLITLIGTLLGAPFSGFMILFILPFIWLFMLLSMWAWAAYLAWAVRTFTDRQLDTVNAFQLATYASVPMLFSFVPLLGFIASIWNLYLNWLALVARVEVKEGTAIMIILVPLLVLVLSFVALIVLLFALMPDLMQTEMNRTMQF